jgi:hypothetical protein
MEINTNLIVKILANMSADFSTLSRQHETITAEEFSHDLLWCFFKNLKEQSDLFPKQHEKLAAEILLFLGCTIRQEIQKPDKKKEEECDLTIQSNHIH